MLILSRSTLLKGLSEISFNLSTGWLGVLLITPGFLATGNINYLELYLKNLPPALFTFTIGVYLSERSSV